MLIFKGKSPKILIENIFAMPGKLLNYCKRFTKLTENQDFYYLSSMLANFLRFPDSKVKILAAVSGGLDSMVMVHLLKEAGFDFDIAHVNFQLRGEESNGDQRFVKQWARENNIGFHTVDFNTKREVERSKESLQMVARRLRYEWFDKLMEDGKYDHLALAHHLDDSLESSFFALIKGGGIAAVSGIPAIRGKVIRPLSDVSRSEIEDYASRKGIEWREDSSNQSREYTRNYIRHEILPLARKINPSLEKTYSSTRKRLDAAARLLEHVVQDIKNKHCEYQSGRYTIGLQWLEEYPSQVLLLHEILRFTGINYEQSTQLHDSLNEVGKQFLTDSHTITVDRDSLIITVPKKEKEVDSQLLTYENAVLHCGPYLLRTRPDDNVELKSEPFLAQFDADKLLFPLEVRSWREGDRFMPLGMKGRKKVSDFLVDQKVPLPLKKDVLVVCSGNEICWIIGMRMDDRFKITTNTKNVFVISAEKR